MLKKPPGAQLGFNIRGGKASQLGIFISKVGVWEALASQLILVKKKKTPCLWFPTCVLLQVVPDSDAHRAGLQEGDQVLSVNDVDFQDIEHSKVSQNKTNI